MQEILINTTRPYFVKIESGILDKVGELTLPLTGARKALVISDSNVAPLYASRLIKSLECSGFDTHLKVFAAGEASKNTDTLIELVNHLANIELTRSDVVFALGGGVTGDLAGLAAALYLRGIRCIQIPTSLLSMVDSSVGGKTAVNLSSGKNLFGTFTQPILVCCDPDLLQTLNDKDWKCGWGEIVKYTLLKDSKLLPLLQNPISKESLNKIICECISIKNEIVSADEFESGKRKLLNLGHTIGHAIEKVSDYKISHGLAVGMGLSVATKISVRLGIARPELLKSVDNLLDRFNLNLSFKLNPEKIFKATHADKKSTGKEITMILPVNFGDCRLVPITFTQLKNLLDDILLD